MTKAADTWRDVLGPEIADDLDLLAEIHYGADPVTMIRRAVAEFIHDDCARNAGIRDRYLFRKTLSK